MEETKLWFENQFKHYLESEHPFIRAERKWSTEQLSQFIKERAKEAAMIYATTLSYGLPFKTAQQRAEHLLFRGLQVSKYRLVAETMSDMELDFFDGEDILKVMKQAKDLFPTVDINDADFEFSPDKIKRELKARIEAGNN